MDLTNADQQPVSFTVDNDSRNLAIIYGSLGTLIAFASLVVAVLSWLRSRRQKLATHHGANGDIDLENNTPQLSSQTERYLSTGNVSHDDRRTSISELAVAHDSGHPSLSGFDGSAVSPSRACENCRAFDSNDNGDLSSIETVTNTPTSDKCLPTTPHGAIHDSQPQPAVELDGKSIHLPNEPERRNKQYPTSICDHSSAALASPAQRSEIV